MSRRAAKVNYPVSPMRDKTAFVELNLTRPGAERTEEIAYRQFHSAAVHIEVACTARRTTSSRQSVGMAQA